MKYYVYQLIDPRDDKPFYVGKGYKRRMYQHANEARSNYWNNKVKCQRICDIWAAGLEIKYLQEFCESDEHSRIREKEWILEFGRLCNNSGTLTNVHVGGNGGGRIGKPICQYTKSGEFVDEYASAAEAERHTNVALSKITAVCRGDWKCAGNFQWKWKGEVPITNYVRQSTNMQPVYQYSMSGEYVAGHNSQHAAASYVGSTVTGAAKISACCAGVIPSYKGFQWRNLLSGSISSIVPQQKQVLQCSMSGEVIKSFDSITHACRETGVSGVSACCNGTYKQAGGYVWKFIST
jgi:hypothetical protein